MFATNPSATGVQDVTLPPLVRYTPFADLDEDRLRLVESFMEVKEAARGEVLIERGSYDAYSYFLASGRVELSAGDGKTFVLDGDSESARNPISDLLPRKYTVRAMGPVSYFIVDAAVVKTLSETDGAPSDAILIEDLGPPTELNQASELLWYRIRVDLAKDRLVLPTLPDVAMKITRALRDEDSDAQKVASIILADPVITAKIVKAANSALFGGGRAPVETCRNAVVRLGFGVTHNLVMSFALKEVFLARTPHIRRRMARLWEHSIRVAAISYVLAGVVHKFNPERVLLAGLLHDIGEVPVLSYADGISGISRESEQIDAIVDRLRAKIGTKVLEKWGFSEELLAVPALAEQWDHDSGGEAAYSDLVIVAQLHAYIGTERALELPPMEQVPAFAKLFPKEISPKDSFKILRRADDKLLEVERLLRG